MTSRAFPPRTYGAYAPRRGLAGVLEQLRAAAGHLVARRRLRVAANSAPRTDDPLVGAAARWVGPAEAWTPGELGVVVGWRPCGWRGDRQYVVEFGPPQQGLTVTTTLPSAQIELV